MEDLINLVFRFVVYGFGLCFAVGSTIYLVSKFFKAFQVFGFLLVSLWILSPAVALLEWAFTGQISKMNQVWEVFLYTSMFYVIAYSPEKAMTVRPWRD